MTDPLSLSVPPAAGSVLSPGGDVLRLLLLLPSAAHRGVQPTAQENHPRHHTKRYGQSGQYVWPVWSVCMISVVSLYGQWGLYV